jgi:hypothetical protein
MGRFWASYTHDAWRQIFALGRLAPALSRVSSMFLPPGSSSGSGFRVPGLRIFCPLGLRPLRDTVRSFVSGVFEAPGFGLAQATGLQAAASCRAADGFAGVCCWSALRVGVGAP